MPKTVKLPDKIVDEAKRYAQVCSRSVPKQIEHWVKIGKTVEENPDLTYDVIKELLLALEEQRAGEVTEFHFEET